MTVASPTHASPSGSDGDIPTPFKAPASEQAVLNKALSSNASKFMTQLSHK